MTGPAPSDLAVAFRSFARRLREASAGVDDLDLMASASPLVTQLEALIARVAGELGVHHDTDLAATGSAIADRIETTPADAWQPGQLKRLESEALEAGNLLRRISGVLGTT
jgi:hypothetical protein